MYSIRISKFDPSRPANERLDDWTSISDIGRSFEGENLTVESYERAEAQYLEAVCLMLREANVVNMLISDVVRSSLASPASEWIEDGRVIDLEEVLAVCRYELREELSCHLESTSGFCLDVGFDFYLYVTTPVSSHGVYSRIYALGLFIEEGVESPYFNP